MSRERLPATISGPTAQFFAKNSAKTIDSAGYAFYIL